MAMNRSLHFALRAAVGMTGWCSVDLAAQIPPIRIRLVYEDEFPFPSPFLQLLLSRNSFGRGFVSFKIDQAFDVVTCGVMHLSLTMLLQTARQVSGDADVEDSSVRTGENVNDRIAFHAGIYRLPSHVSHYYRLYTIRHPDRSRAQRGEVEGPVNTRDEKKVPPLRFAPVGMTVGRRRLNNTVAPPPRFALRSG